MWNGETDERNDFLRIRGRCRINCGRPPIMADDDGLLLAERIDQGDDILAERGD